MSFLRNMLTALGVLAIIAISIFIFRPDLYNNAIGKPATPQTPAPTGQVYGMLSSQRGTLIEDTSAPTDGLKFAFSEIIDGEAVDVVPAPNVPFLLVINKSKNEMRYWKLNKNIRNVSLREGKSTAFDVKFKQINAQGAPFQAILWVPRETDLNLKFELGAKQ
jgi:hypothetical protein